MQVSWIDYYNVAHSIHDIFWPSAYIVITATSIPHVSCALFNGAQADPLVLPNWLSKIIDPFLGNKASFEETVWRDGMLFKVLLPPHTLGSATLCTFPSLSTYNPHANRSMKLYPSIYLIAFPLYCALTLHDHIDE